MQQINVLENGLISSIDKLQTKQLQNIIDNLKEETTLLFPRGTYLLSTIFLKSNLHFVFESGCVILGSSNFYDYAKEEEITYPLYQDSSHSYFDCSLFTGKNINNVSFIGPSIIDMQDSWDLDNVRDIVHRGPKAFAFKECRDLIFKDFTLKNVTDLAIYFAGSENVLVKNIKMRVYIDGVSPDNSKNVLIEDCDIESGDDAIVFKSSYTLNRLDICESIEVRNCSLKSRCNAIKFGTETNGGFKNIYIHDIAIKETRLCGLAIESVDGAIIEDIKIENINMKNVNAPLFIHLGKRMRGPKELTIGSIKNITINNIRATGPYLPYEVVAWNYDSYIKKDSIQYPWIFGSAEGVNDLKVASDGPWQFISNVCGLKEHPLTNIVLTNFDFTLSGGCNYYHKRVPEDAQDYPEVYVYGKILPAKGIYFRHIDGLILKNINIKTLNDDIREDLIFDDIKNLNIIKE